MAKRIIKPDSGNTLVLQEDNGSIDALTVETNGDVTLAGNFTSKGIDDNASSTALTIDASGNVGIGGSPSAKLEVLGTAPTYTNSATVFWGGTTHDSSKNGVVLYSSGDSLSGGIGSNLTFENSTAFTQTNTARSSGYITFSNTTTASKTSDIIFGGSVSGSTSGVERMRIDSSGNLKFDSGYGSVATAYGCRAWVNFNGTGTVAIRASGNVSSVTDNAQGLYTINFTNSMIDTNYSVSGVAVSNHQGTTGSNGRTASVSPNLNGTYSTTALQVITKDSSDQNIDSSKVLVQIFR